MRPSLTDEMARVVVDDRIAAAERFRRQKEACLAASRPDGYETVTVRLAGDRDVDAVRRLAERDGRAVPRRPLLVVEVEGTLLAARSLADGYSVADPFRHTAHLVELLALRTAHLRGEGRSPRRRRVTERLALAAGWLSRHTAASP
jgi:hypothetical protein